MDDPVALIEISDGHDECLYAQIRFLHAYGRSVHLIVSDRLAEKRLDPNHGADRVEVLPVRRGLIGTFRTARRVADYLLQHGIRQAVLNTAQSKPARTMCLLMPRNVEIFGILHDGRKLLQWTANQALISLRIKKYFVLNDYVLKNIGPLLSGPEVASFYPIFFPVETERLSQNPLPPGEDRVRGTLSAVTPSPQPSPKGRGGGVAIGTADRPDDALVVAIPGPISAGARDYIGLIDALAREPLDDRVRFVLAGSADNDHGREVRRRVAETGQERRFMFFDAFLDYPTLLGQLSGCDVVLPLIHRATPAFGSYTRYQISGTFNLAFAVRKPLLMHETFRGAEDFERSALFYREETLIARLNELAANPALLAPLQANLAHSEKLDFAYQAQRYARFLQPKRFAVA